MRAPEKLHAVAQQAMSFGRRWAPRVPPSACLNGNGTSADAHPRDGYPRDIVDLIVFHKLHLALPADQALKSFQALKQEFVDWNEVRVSSVREIQEAFSLCPGSLALAVFVKDLLESVHRERQDVSLEFLTEQNLGDIRRYLKQIRGIDHSTVEMILRLRKEHPVFPLSPAVETVLTRLGVVRPSETRSQSEKLLHEMVDPARAIVLHHFLLDHSRAVCPPDEAAVDCPHCAMRQMCAFYARTSSKHRKRSANALPLSLARGGDAARSRFRGALAKRARPAGRGGARKGLKRIVAARKAAAAGKKIRRASR